MAKRKTSTKSVSTPTSRGKMSVEKGAKFENMVADIFRLLGAEVVQNIEICQKKVDIFATFRLPGVPLDTVSLLSVKTKRELLIKIKELCNLKDY